ncbi:hypothetical protein [Dickeya fangzhongdai]|uniref:hypothetical protein n=1 Tax=Dickeya fangzhongdai TaxID=1778540 RepID=UPI0023E42D93|nr:hypothetical protein [Dickeya fangzhongdai]WES88940.1 hypothetical protein PQ617_22525 [Dickeya fangzhongdai]
MDLNAACWVVRPGQSYAYYEEFLFGKVAAIGHLDDFISEETQITVENIKNIFKEVYINNANQGLTKHSIASNLSQVKKFLFEMSIGDLIFTIGEGFIVAGVITSDAYISEVPISIGKNTAGSNKNDLNFKLRRNVEWGQSYPKERIPLAVRRSFTANQTVFSTAEHIKYIYHWLNVIFISNGTVYASSRINQNQDIHHYSVTKFSETLNYFEALSILIEENFYNKNLQDEIDVCNIINRLSSLAEEGSLNLTTQQLFMSPGDYWTGFSGGNVAIVAFTIAICCLFNVKPVFANESENKIAEEIYTPVSTAVDKIRDENNMELVVGKLELAFPEQNRKVVSKSEELKKVKFPDVSKSEKGVR